MDDRKTPPEERAEKVREEYGPTAKVVAPYKPNRKQRRAQASKQRQK